MDEESDHFSNFVQVKAGNGPTGAKRLCQALRQIFATFGVPEEISSDGGPEFVAQETQDFFNRWGIKHRLSSAYFPQSNGRAELAVKATKRLLEDNIGPNGELNTDRVVCALLQHRNTPDRDCSLSPAEILFGRSLRDGMPLLKKSTMIFDNNQVREQWQESWAAKETAIRSRLVRNCENLEANSKNLQPLREGDSVFIQNQVLASRRPKKWDRQGVIIATGEHDQYLVRVAGTGRLTLRNRRFLRRFQEESSATNTMPQPITCPATRLTGRREGSPGAEGVSSSGDMLPEPDCITAPEHVSDAHDLQTDTALPQDLQRISSAIDAPATLGGVLAHEPPTSGKLRGRPPGCITKKASRAQQLLRNLQPCGDWNASAATRGDFGEQEDMSTSKETCSKPGTEVPSPRRSERVKTVQKLYDASTGR